jgi:hypothetical protein
MKYYGFSYSLNRIFDDIVVDWQIMPDSFVVLWSKKRCHWLQQVCDSGPLEVVFGGPHTSMPSINNLKVGDTIYTVYIDGGSLFIIASLKIDSLISPEAYVSRRFGITRPDGKLWDQFFDEIKISRPAIGHRIPHTCADLAAIGSCGSRIKFDRKISGRELEFIRLGPSIGDEKPIKGIMNGNLLNNLSFFGHVRRLSEQSKGIFSKMI